MIITRKCEKHTGKISLDNFGYLFEAEFLEDIVSWIGDCRKILDNRIAENCDPDNIKYQQPF